MQLASHVEWHCHEKLLEVEMTVHDNLHMCSLVLTCRHKTISRYRRARELDVLMNRKEERLARTCLYIVAPPLRSKGNKERRKVGGS